MTTRLHCFYLSLIFLQTFSRGMIKAVELYKIIQTAKIPLKVSPSIQLKIAIIGSGYAGLSCGYYASKIAHTVKIFGLEDGPGMQQSSCASTISAGLLHPLTPRGRVIYRGEEAFEASLALLDEAQGHSKEKVCQRFPGEDTKEAVTRDISSPVGESAFTAATEPTEHRPPRAMLRPLFRESDAANWRKAAVTNSKWVGLLNEEQMKDLYANGGGHADDVDGASDSTNSNSISSGAASAQTDLQSVAPSNNPDARVKPLGVAVIKSAVVVDSKAYLQGLWRCISRVGGEEGAVDGDGDARSVTYERRQLSAGDVEQLSKDFDIVIMAAGAGAQSLWGGDNPLPFTYVRGQNVELQRLSSDVALDTDDSDGTLDSVLLAGEYVIPKTHRPVEGGEVRKTLLIGGTHEHALTMAELSAPANMEIAYPLLRQKALSMYPPLESEGWKPYRCIAGIRVVPARTNLGRLPAAGRHFNLSNVWLIGGLGSRGLLYHALLAQLVLQEATAAATATATVTAPAV